ncbi:MAG TPA: aromatic acid exporter family protein, partial [Pseudonocardia sp.]|nr:aromatic acid exporter family protein [Pseudonocardia sp.]
MKRLRELWRSAVRRLRERGRSAAARAIRLTGAAVAAFVVAEQVGLDDPPPLIAALTALIVVQVTLTETLVNGLQRVASVVSGVLVALLFVSVVGLSWWSLGLLVGASIVVGQLLRLGPQLIEAPISAMLVLGVGYLGEAEMVATGRVLETLVGTAVGLAVNLAVPPSVQSRYAVQALQKLADEIAGLLRTAS